MAAVNAAEVYSKLIEWQLTPEEQVKFQTVLRDMVVPYDNDLALRTGALRTATKALGLSLGDRACLALAQRLQVPAVTADRAWAKLAIGVAVEVIR